MNHTDIFFKSIGIDKRNSLVAFAKVSTVPVNRLLFYNETNTMPTGIDLDKICLQAAITPLQLQLRMGIVDRNIEALLRTQADSVFNILKSESIVSIERHQKLVPSFETSLGKLFRGDCLDVMRNIPSDSVDLCFADPPFNLDKLYPSQIDDNLKVEQYLSWCEEWASECCRILKPGGSLFIWNLPKWNGKMSAFLGNRLTFRHWISVDIKYRLPIAGRLYPSHYSLLYFCKGEKPNAFHPDRLPMEVCPSCSTDLKDYGGYKDKMNPLGVNLADVWYDIPPVRHAKYKRRLGANELSIKLMDRIIEMASNVDDLVFDPFGGAGTTYIVAELKNRRWIGAEIGPLTDIEQRFKRIDEEREYIHKLRQSYNKLFTDETLRRRNILGLWTSDSVRNGKHQHRKRMVIASDDLFANGESKVQ